MAWLCSTLSHISMTITGERGRWFSANVSHYSWKKKKVQHRPRQHTAIAECCWTTVKCWSPYRLCAFSREVVSFYSTTFQEPAKETRPSRMQHSAACHPCARKGRWSALHMPLFRSRHPVVCNRILLQLASRRHFQVPYGDAGRERISVPQKEVGAATHSFTSTPFFPGLKWVIWWTVGEQASFISVSKGMRKKKIIILS